MKKGYLYFFTVLAISCQKPSPTEVIKPLQEVSYEGIKFPEPKYDGVPQQLIDRMKEKYEAEKVVIGRPIIFKSKDEYSYWLKIEFLNPTIGKMTFKDFGKSVALDLIEHIDNFDDFDKIEVSAVTKRGFIITYATKQNIFFKLDSLRY